MRAPDGTIITIALPDKDWEECWHALQSTIEGIEEFNSDGREMDVDEALDLAAYTRIRDSLAAELEKNGVQPPEQ